MESATPPHQSSLYATVAAMQKLTRQKNDFEKVEASLPDPRSATLQVASLPAATDIVGGSFSIVGDILHKIGAANPFARRVVAGDEVWLFDNTAYQDEGSSEWQAEFITAIFKKEPKCKIADMVSGIAKTVGIAEDAEEMKTIEERVLPFLWDVRVAKIVDAGAPGGDVELTLGPTSVNGIATNILTVGQQDNSEIIMRHAKVGEDISGILKMDTFHAPPEGWGIISGKHTPHCLGETGTD